MRIYFNKSSIKLSLYVPNNLFLESTNNINYGYFNSRKSKQVAGREL